MMANLQSNLKKKTEKEKVIPVVLDKIDVLLLHLSHHIWTNGPSKVIQIIKSLKWFAFSCVQNHVNLRLQSMPLIIKGT